MGPPRADGGTHLEGMTLSIHSPDELIAVIPHMLGFQPEESIVFLPMGSDLPVARVDIPTTARDQDLVWRSIRDGLTQGGMLTPGSFTSEVVPAEGQSVVGVALTPAQEPGLDLQYGGRVCGAEAGVDNTGYSACRTQALTGRKPSPGISSLGSVVTRVPWAWSVGVAQRPPP